MPRFVGADNDVMQWVTPSGSREGLEHEQTLYKRGPSMGDVTCSCEDAVYRSKIGRVSATSVEYGGACRHVVKLLHLIGGVLKPQED